MNNFDLDIVATRGETVESRHRVHAAVTNADGLMIATAGDPRAVASWRSCAKPFQVMPFLESGAFDDLLWGDDELALACASHGGEPEHVAIVESMLQDIGLEEGDLACGPHDPLSSRGAKLARDAGVRPTRLHNNCSGKHAAMLARAQGAAWPIAGYERLGHPVQVAILDTVAHWTALPVADVDCAVDGCGVVAFGLPITAMAGAYARFACAVKAGEEVPTRIASAMRARPFLIGGTERFDTVLLEETNGAVLAKVGAEGVHSVALMDQGIGFAIKVEDGGQRAQYPAVVRLLQHLGALSGELPPRLSDFLRRPIRNTRGEVVGEVRPNA